MEQPLLTLVVDNNSTRILGLDPQSTTYQLVKKVLRYRPDDALFRIQQHQKKQRFSKQKWDWDGYVNLVCRDKRCCRCPVRKEGVHFSTGLYSKVIQLFKDYNIPYQTADNRQRYERNFELEMSESFEERDYQSGVVDLAAEVGRGIIQMATGSGKTPMSAKLIKEIGVRPFIFYVPSIDLLKQTQEEFSNFLRVSGTAMPVGAVGGGIFDPQDITVMTIQTAVRSCGQDYHKYDEEDSSKDDKTLDDKRKEIFDLVSGAKGIVCDECQHWASETCQTISDYSVSARYRYALSATPFRDKGDDILIEACFGKTIANINASFLIERGYLVKPDIFFVKIPHDQPLNGFTYQTIYKNHIVENVTRNTVIADLANSMAKNGSTILILVRQINHGKILEKLIPDSVFLHGSHTGKQRKKHIDKMRDQKAQITIASTIFDEGIDCRPLDTLILAGSGKSQTRALQRVGRTLRPYTDANGKVKTKATIFDFNDPYKYLKSHSNKRRQIYETEPEFNIEELNN